MIKETLTNNQRKQIERVLGKNFTDTDIPSYWKAEEWEEQNFFHAYWAERHGAVCDENGWRI